MQSNKMTTMNKCSVLLVVAIVLSITLNIYAAPGDFQLTGLPTSAEPESTFQATFKLDVGTQILGNYKVDLEFDPGVLNVTSITGGTADGFTAPPTIDGATPTPTGLNGRINFGAINATASNGATGLLTLAVVNFSVVGAAGTSSPVSVTAERIRTLGFPSSNINTVPLNNNTVQVQSAGLTISGRITRNGAGESGVTVTPSSGTAVTTNANGDYTLTVGKPFTGTVTPTKSGLTFDPASRSYTAVTSNQTGQNYTVPCTVTLSPDQIVPSVAGTAQFTVTSSGDWSITDNQNWASVSPTSGTGNATVTVDYGANPGTTQRSVTLTVTRTNCTGGIDRALLRQEGKPEEEGEGEGSAEGEGEGTLEGEGEGTVEGEGECGGVSSLPAPANFVAGDDDYDCVYLTWDEVDGASDYRVYRGPVGGDFASAVELTSIYIGTDYAYDCSATSGLDQYFDCSGNSQFLNPWETPQGCGSAFWDGPYDYSDGPTYQYFITAVDADGCESEPATDTGYSDKGKAGQASVISGDLISLLVVCAVLGVVSALHRLRRAEH